MTLVKQRQLYILLNGKTGDTIPCIIESDEITPSKRKEWARLIQKIYEVDPLTCPKCKGVMKIISVIEHAEVIKAILKHVGLWETQKRPPPNAPSGSLAGLIRC